MNRPPQILNPVEAKKAQAILSRPHSVPRGHQTAQDLPQAHREELSPTPKRLDAEKTWFFPALAYCMMGMDRSLFALFSLGLGRDVTVTTYQAGHPLARMSGVTEQEYPWFGMVQGIDRALGTPFIDYVETFRFSEPGETPVDWKLRGSSVRIADPFVQDEFRVGVDVVFLLPINVTLNRHVTFASLPGLQLLDPVLCVRQLGEHT